MTTMATEAMMLIKTTAFVAMGMVALPPGTSGRGGSTGQTNADASAARAKPSKHKT